MTYLEISRLTDEALIEELQKIATLVACYGKQKGLKPDVRRRLHEAKARAEIIRLEIKKRSYVRKLAESGQQLMVETQSPWCSGHSSIRKVAGRV